jgi:hypothetical protein
MKKLFLPILAIFLTSQVYAWTIKESKQDEDVQIIVNDGGTFKEAIKVEGSDASVILGPVGGGSEQLISHDLYFGNTSRVRLNRQSNYFGMTLINDDNNTKLDLVTVEAGNAYMTGTADGDVVVASAGNMYFTPDRGSTNGGRMSTTGAWTLGPSSFTGQHRINGNIGLPSTIGGNPAATFGTVFLGNTGSCGTVACDMTMDMTMPGNSDAFVGMILNVSGAAFNGPQALGATFSVRGRRDALTCATIGTNTLPGGYVNSITCTIPSAGVVRISIDGAGSANSLNAHVSGLATFWNT